MHGRSNSRAHQDRRAAVGAGRQDYLSGRYRFSVREADAGSTLAVEHHAVDLDITHDRQVRTPAHVVSEIGHAGVDALAIHHVQEIGRYSMLLRSVEVAD